MTTDDTHQNLAPATNPDGDTLTAITNAVALGHSGDPDTARASLLALWPTTRDPLHRCVLAHYLADLHPDPAEALTWDVRALDAAETVPPGHATSPFNVTAFYPSLHLNLADNYRRLGSFTAATRELASAQSKADALPDDAYGATIRAALTKVTTALSAQDRNPLS
jgi:hypothetical protein